MNGWLCISFQVTLIYYIKVYIYTKNDLIKKTFPIVAKFVNMTSTRKREGNGGEVLKFAICHVFADSVFKQWIYCSFLRMRGFGGYKIGHFFFVNVINE